MSEAVTSVRQPCRMYDCILTTLVALGAVFFLWGLLGFRFFTCFLPASFQPLGCSPISISSRAISYRMGSTGPPTTGTKYHAAAPPAAFIPLYMELSGTASPRCLLRIALLRVSVIILECRSRGRKISREPVCAYTGCCVGFGAVILNPLGDDG